MNQLLQSSVHVLIALAFVYVAKLLADKRTVDIDDDHEIEENSNSAIGFRRAGLYGAIFIGLSASLTGTSTGFGSDIMSQLFDGVIIVAFMFLARAVNDKFMLSGIDNDEHAKNKNTAVGLVEFGSYIATGFILNGAFSGSDQDFKIGLMSAVLFAILGQVALVVLYRVYDIITPAFKVSVEIEKGNNAAGVAICGMLIALGVILRASIVGPFVSWSADIKSFAISAALGIVALIVLRAIIDKVFLPNTKLFVEIQRDQNVAALVMAQSLIIGSAHIIASAL